MQGNIGIKEIYTMQNSMYVHGYGTYAELSIIFREAADQ